MYSVGLFSGGVSSVSVNKSEIAANFPVDWADVLFQVRVTVHRLRRGRRFFRVEAATGRAKVKMRIRSNETERSLRPLTRSHRKRVSCLVRRGREVLRGPKCDCRSCGLRHASA